MPAPIVVPPRVARLEAQRNDDPPRSALVITSIMPLDRYPEYGVLTTLTLDIDVLLFDLSHPLRSQALRFTAASITSLTLTHSSAPSTILSEEALDNILRFVQSLRKLDYLTIKDFVLNDPSEPRPGVPACVGSSPLVVDTLTIANSHGPSLSFLLMCANARRIVLISSSFDRRALASMLSL
ncbi:hypothetical protein NMY22_g7 [Coprinellus aureogranulatus]|nr:hypothetical protein NMY22_g7 [Coprinellus aureogranulatus]